MKQLFVRFKAEMPRFWKIYRNVMAFICTGSTAVWIANTELQLNFPDLIVSFLKYAIFVTLFCGFTAQMTKK